MNSTVEVISASDPARATKTRAKKLTAAEKVIVAAARKASRDAARAAKTAQKEKERDAKKAAREAAKAEKAKRKPNNQNDIAERVTCDLLGLIHNPGRMGIDAHDEFANGYELKGKTKRSCSTSRDFNRAYIEKNRDLYWIVVDGYHEDGTFKVERVSLMVPERMVAFWDTHDRELAEIEEENNEVIANQRAKGWSEKRLETLTKRLERGSRKNDPQLSGVYIDEHGIDLTADPKRMLREAIAQFPIKGRSQ